METHRCIKVKENPLKQPNRTVIVVKIDENCCLDIEKNSVRLLAMKKVSKRKNYRVAKDSLSIISIKPISSSGKC